MNDDNNKNKKKEQSDEELLKTSPEASTNTASFPTSTPT